MRSINRRLAYLPLAEMFAVWALVVAWAQLLPGDMSAHERAGDPPPAPPETPETLQASETVHAVAEPLAAAASTPAFHPSGLAQASHPAHASCGSSGMLTHEAPPALNLAVEMAHPALPGTPALSSSATAPSLAPQIAIAAETPAAEASEPPPGDGGQTPPDEDPPVENDVPPPFEDDWVWETDANGNIIARIESPPMQVSVGHAPVNIWGGAYVQDPDSPESFRPIDSAQGQWGSLTLYEDGSWNYVESAAHAAFQKGFSIETFQIESFDGTQAQVVIWLQYATIGDLLAA